MSHLSIDQITSLADRVRAVVDDVLTDSQLFVVDVVVRGVFGSRAVEIYIDGDKPVDVAVLARLGREIGFMLDSEEVIEGKYQLTVSSPGLDRPLKMPRQFGKQVGRRLRIKLSEEGVSKVEGELTEVAPEYVTLALPNGEKKQISFGEISEARIVLPW